MKPNEYGPTIKIDAVDMIDNASEFLGRIVPNITIRNNQSVYVTINNYTTMESDKE